MTLRLRSLWLRSLWLWSLWLGNLWLSLRALHGRLWPLPLIAPLLLLRRASRSAHGQLHGLTELFERLRIGSVHLLGYAAEILARLNDVAIVAMQFVGIAQHLHHALHTLRTRRTEAHRTPKVLQCADGFQFVSVEVAGVGVENGQRLRPFLQVQFEYGLLHLLVLFNDGLANVVD